MICAGEPASTTTKARPPPPHCERGTTRRASRAKCRVGGGLRAKRPAQAQWSRTGAAHLNRRDDPRRHQRGRQDVRCAGQCNYCEQHSQRSKKSLSCCALKTGGLWQGYLLLLTRTHKHMAPRKPSEQCAEAQHLSTHSTQQQLASPTPTRTSHQRHNDRGSTDDPASPRKYLTGPMVCARYSIADMSL